MSQSKGRLSIFNDNEPDDATDPKVQSGGDKEQPPNKDVQPQVHLTEDGDYTVRSIHLMNEPGSPTDATSKRYVDDITRSITDKIGVVNEKVSTIAKKFLELETKTNTLQNQIIATVGESSRFADIISEFKSQLERNIEGVTQFVSKQGETIQKLKSDFEQKLEAIESNVKQKEASNTNVASLKTEFYGKINEVHKTVLNELDKKLHAFERVLQNINNEPLNIEGRDTAMHPLEEKVLMLTDSNTFLMKAVSNMEQSMVLYTEDLRYRSKVMMDAAELAADAIARINVMTDSLLEMSRRVGVVESMQIVQNQPVSSTPTDSKLTT